MSTKCQYCDKKFVNKYVLKKHQNTAKYCLKIQGKDIEQEYYCDGCKNFFSRKDNFVRHRDNCVELLQKKHRKEIELLKEKHETEIDLLKSDISVLKKEIGRLKIKNKKCRRENISLQKQLSKSDGKFIGYDKAITKHKPKTINTYINPKLVTIKTNNIRPFTLKTIQEELEDGKFTQDMFKRGSSGLVDFLSGIIKFENEDGEVERNYACTDSSRNKFHRLVESKEWQQDNGAHFLNEIIDDLAPLADEYRKVIGSNLKRTDYVERCLEDKELNDDNRVLNDKIRNKINPIRNGYVNSKGRDREKLFNETRNKICNISTV